MNRGVRMRCGGHYVSKTHDIKVPAAYVAGFRQEMVTCAVAVRLLVRAVLWSSL